MNESKRPWQRLNNILKSKMASNMKLFFSMLFQTTPKMPSFYPTFTCPIAHTMKLTTKVFIFLSFQSRKKKVEVRVPSYKTKQKTLFMKIASDKFSLHVSLHVCTNFKMKTKISAPLKITF